MIVFLQVKKLTNKEKKAILCVFVQTVFFMYTALKKTFWQLDESASKMGGVFPCFFFNETLSKANCKWTNTKIKLHSKFSLPLESYNGSNKEAHVHNFF